jgi:hypothetical protein
VTSLDAIGWSVQRSGRPREQAESALIRALAVPGTGS